MQDSVFNKNVPIAIGADHAGFEYKAAIIAMLQSAGWQVEDHGTNSTESCDYPDFAHAVGYAIDGGDAEVGILICGSGNGVCMAANKHASIRAALCWNEELSTLARSHNNANVLCLPARFISLELSKKIVDLFLSTPFEGGRHQKRAAKI